MLLVKSLDGAFDDAMLTSVDDEPSSPARYFARLK